MRVDQVNRARFRYGLLTALLIGAPGAADAQDVTVQQPVFQVFSVDTVVSVPDRGSAYLGGVSSAAEGRGTYGLFPLGSGTGLRRMDTGVSAGVYIHDFEAMDEFLLSRPSGARDAWVNPNTRAAAAYNALHNQRSLSSTHDDGAAGISRSATAAAQASGPPQTDDPAVLAGFYLDHARDAEARGKGGVAMLCYRMAARHGSSFAEEKLRALSAQ